jgi:predicted signal transduction protein with EAL and GGDEF domain
MEVPGVGHVTASLGIATFPQHASSRDTLVVAADRALYDAKNAGRNCVCVPPDDAQGGSEAEAPAQAEMFPTEKAEADGSSLLVS